MNDFAEFEALSFDCYGTLIDWESGIAASLRTWADRRGVAASDEELLGLFSEIENVVEGMHSPALLYPDVLRETMRRIGERCDAEVTDAEADSFGDSVRSWPAFPDSTAALARLKERFKLIIVSNVDRASFAASNQHLGVGFDRIITAEDVGAYKPHPPHFVALFQALPKLGVSKDRLLHVAQSLYHDHEPARRYGLPSVWIDRRQDRAGYGATPPPPGSVEPRWRFPSLEAFADAVEQNS